MFDLTGLRQILTSPKKILITTHHKPDADALGSSLALWAYLNKKGHQTTVVAPSDYPSFLQWMPGESSVIVYEGNEPHCDALAAQCDILFCLDFNGYSRINLFQEAVTQSPALKVMIDHHLEPEIQTPYFFSDTHAAATCELVYLIIEGLGDKALIDISIGECLYAGMMTDTGSFRHPSTTSEVHRIAAELITLGVNTSRIHQLIYDNNTENRLRFLGFALSQKLKIVSEYHTAYMAFSESELKAYDSQTGDTEGLVNYPLSIAEVHMSVVIIERKDGVKLSFRSKGDLAVNAIAKEHFEGGGHKNAAGGKSSQTLEQTLEKLLTLLPTLKEKLLQAGY